MAAFAPIPLAFLGMDATRQIGLGYLKSFGAVCIAGVIILVLLISFPLVLGGLTGANPGTAPGRRGRRTGSPTRCSTWPCACCSSWPS